MTLSYVNFTLRLLQNTSIGCLAPCINNLAHFQMITRSKHWKPEFKWLRKRKVIKVKLPNFEEKDTDELTPEEIRSKMKEKGIQPPRPWNERPFYISCTGGAFEPYVPPEGDGKMSVVTMHGAKQKVQLLEKKSKSMMAIRKIRSFDEDFNAKEFALEAQEIYINAHINMASKNFTEIQKYVTERIYPEMKHNVEDKTIHWKFIQSLEPPRVVHARSTDVITKENQFGQVTVRFHTQQILALYDRFGRLMHGSEILAKDVLEYIVFEKHLSNQYGTWRLHEKIIPNWMPPKQPVLRTFRAPKEEDEPPEDDTSKESPKTKDSELEKQPQVAVASS